MLLKVQPLAELTALTAAAAIDAEACDKDGKFPCRAFDALAAGGVFDDPPISPDRAVQLLWLLAAVGRGDLSVGRILEGHLNVLILLERFATRDVKQSYLSSSTAGRLFGLWNTDAPTAKLTISNQCFQGAKSFCTGIDELSQALVTVETQTGRQMYMVPLDGVAVDRTWWKPLGMKASGSHMVDFSGLALDAAVPIGKPGDYLLQPLFSAGAMRFLAVHTGGIHSVVDICINHLRQTKRTGDAYQKHRLGEMASLVETAYGWLLRCADSWRRACNDQTQSAEAVATVNAARCVVEQSSLRVLELAECSVGAAGMISPHPLERKIRDLRTYLRQPNPDGALAHFGEAVADGHWSPGRLR